MDLSEHNHASEISRILFRYNLILINHAEGRLRIPADPIELMSGFPTMKIEGFPIINIAERHGIGIAMIAGYRQYA